MLVVEVSQINEALACALTTRLYSSHMALRKEWKQEQAKPQKAQYTLLQIDMYSSFFYQADFFTTNGLTSVKNSISTLIPHGKWDRIPLLMVKFL